MCDGLQKMSQNLKLLADLKTQQEKILSGAKQLELDMEKFDKEIELEVDNVLERTSYVIKKPTNIQGYIHSIAYLYAAVVLGWKPGYVIIKISTHPC